MSPPGLTGAGPSPVPPEPLPGGAPLPELPGVHPVKQIGESLTGPSRVPRSRSREGRSDNVTAGGRESTRGLVSMGRTGRRVETRELPEVAVARCCPDDGETTGEGRTVPSFTADLVHTASVGAATS